MELLTKLLKVMGEFDKCSHNQALHLPDESTLNLPEKALGQQGADQSAGLCLSSY